MRTNLGTDLQSRAMGALSNTAKGTAASSITATTASLTGLDGTGGTALWNGQILDLNGVFGVILSNTAANPTVVTVDKWYDPATPFNPLTTASTPSTGAWEILPGMAPAMWMGITVDTGSPAATDTVLTSEETAAGLGRAAAAPAYAHTASATTYTITRTFTYTGGSSKTLHKIGIFNSAVVGGIMLFVTNLNADAIVAVNGDAVTVTDTVTI
ncbi:MAG TPA: hypothetical protein VF244_01575 [Acidimicrobiales bacterium]